MRELYHEFVALVDDDSIDDQATEDVHILSRKSMFYSNQTQQANGELDEHYEQTSIGLYVVGS